MDVSDFGELVVERDCPFIEVSTRRPEGFLGAPLLDRPEATRTLSALDSSMLVAEVYREVTFPPGRSPSHQRDASARRADDWLDRDVGRTVVTQPRLHVLGRRLATPARPPTGAAACRSAASIMPAAISSVHT